MIKVSQANMPEAVINNVASLFSELFKTINNLYNTIGLEGVKKIVAEVIRRLRREGMYRVLEYESALELVDSRGHSARFRKREKVQYLQDNIIAFQDQAWGDGKILVDYQCEPGIPVDQHRSGFKTHILISLREVKGKNDTDEFVINWKIKKGFLKNNGFWGTEISHDTDHVKTQVLFPKTRPPIRVTILEKNKQKTVPIGRDNIKQLPDGKWLVNWEKSKPTLHEQYIMSWVW
jgi:hypothetical protein